MNDYGFHRPAAGLRRPLLPAFALGLLLLCACSHRSPPAGNPPDEPVPPAPQTGAATVDPGRPAVPDRSPPQKAPGRGQTAATETRDADDHRAPGSRRDSIEVAAEAPRRPGQKAQDVQRQRSLAFTTVPHHPTLPPYPRPPVYPPADGERYPEADDNPVRLTAEAPVSTFSIDVDTAAYANVRRLLESGQLPPRDAVRLEELINYFSYDYPTPRGDDAFAVYTELGPSPWHSDRQLLHIGIQGQALATNELPPANLVFLVDVSGSMNHPAKLPLLQSALKLLARQLGPQDRISLVAYAGAAGEVLAPTAGDERSTILNAIDGLRAGGSTNGGAGIELAYRLAQRAFIDGGINRVILATDGDFNVGAVSLGALKAMISDKRRSGVALSVLGFGSGNTNDALMQELAQNGDGNAAYIDSLTEARKVLVDERAATLMTIARDVKIQVEFNPAQVAEYRLLGFETRALAREDFNNDAVDAGDIGAGHTVTALYEVTLTGSAGRQVDPLRYGSEATAVRSGDRRRTDEIAFVKLRYKPADADASRLLSRAVPADALQTELADTSERYRFAAAVAAFGQALRQAPYLGDYSLLDAAALAESARGADRFGYRSEFLQLARTADALVGARGTGD